MVKFDIRYMLMLRSVEPLRVYAYNVFWLRFANRYNMYTWKYTPTLTTLLLNILKPTRLPKAPQQSPSCLAQR